MARCLASVLSPAVVTHGVRRKQSAVLTGFGNVTGAALPGSIWDGQSAGNHSAGNGTEPFLFVGVLSVPHSFERRRVARETWIGSASAEVVVRFVMYKVSLTRVSEKVSDNVSDNVCDGKSRITCCTEKYSLGRRLRGAECRQRRLTPPGLAPC